MFTRLRERSGSAGLIVAILALVIALAGTAYAAAKLNSVQKKEVGKIAKKYAGKPGKDGAPGVAGPQGAKGDTGAAGAAGRDGNNGTNGEPGEPGEAGVCSVSEPECTMPPGATFTGIWGVSTAGGLEGYAPISFPLRHTGSLTVQIVNGPATTECPGSVENPEALPGNLCIYVKALENFTFCCNAIGALDDHSGALLVLPVTNEAEQALARGTWAVTQ